MTDEPATELDTERVLELSRKLDKVLQAGITETRMADDLKIKGLGETAARVKAGIAAVRDAAGRTDSAAKAFVTTADALTKQLDDARADMEFEATQLGNAPPASAT